MESRETQFVLCINNDGCDDLEVRKVYEVLADDKAAVDDYIRVIDESGEDYIYPASCFCPVELAAAVRDTLLQAA